MAAKYAGTSLLQANEHESSAVTMTVMMMMMMMMFFCLDFPRLFDLCRYRSDERTSV